MDGVNSYTCECPTGITGTNYSVDIDECDSVPCLNGTTCIDGLNSFTCICLPGHTGSNCSVNIDECASDPCENDGTCIDETNNFICLCAPGYTGSECSMNIDECNLQMVPYVLMALINTPVNVHQALLIKTVVPILTIVVGIHA